VLWSYHHLVELKLNNMLSLSLNNSSRYNAPTALGIGQGGWTNYGQRFLFSFWNVFPRHVFFTFCNVFPIFSGMFLRLCFWQHII